LTTTLPIRISIVPGEWRPIANVPCFRRHRHVRRQRLMDHRHWNYGSRFGFQLLAIPTLPCEQHVCIDATLRTSFETDTLGSNAAAASLRRNSGSWFGRPLRLPGLGSDSVKAVFIKSKMMATTLMSFRASVYDGRREVLTHKSFIFLMKRSKLHDIAPFQTRAQPRPFDIPHASSMCFTKNCGE